MPARARLAPSASLGRRCPPAWATGLHLLCGVLWLAVSAAVTAREVVEGEAYDFGVVPQYPASQVHTIWEPILEAVSQRARVELDLAGSPDISGFERQLEAGCFDFAYMNPYHLIRAHQAQGYQPLLRDLDRSLFGILVVRADSDIEGPDDLDGRRLAMPAPNALGASLLLRAELVRQFGLVIEPWYVRRHSSVYVNVSLGLAAAGGGVQRTLDQQPQALREQLRVIHRTEAVPPHPVAVHPRVPEAVQDRVLAAFLALGESDKGRALLAEIPIRRVGPAALVDYARVEELGLDAFAMEPP